MILELANWSPEQALWYKWGYSYKEIIKFYQRKNKIFSDRFNLAVEIAVDIVSAALGGKKKKSEDEVNIDSGEGIEEMTEEQEAALREALGEDFDKIYGIQETTE